MDAPLKTKFYAYPEPLTAQILGGASSPAYNAALGFAAHSYYLAQTRLQADLDRQDWCYLADVLNSTITDPHWTASCVALEVYDAHRLNGTGDKWYAKDPEARVKKLLATVQAWDYPTTQAMLCTIRFFWEHYLDVDAVADDWWTLEYRCRHVSNHKAKRGAK